MKSSNDVVYCVTTRYQKFEQDWIRAFFTRLIFKQNLTCRYRLLIKRCWLWLWFLSIYHKDRSDDDSDDNDFVYSVRISEWPLILIVHLIMKAANWVTLHRSSGYTAITKVTKVFNSKCKFMGNVDAYSRVFWFAALPSYTHLCYNIHPVSMISLGTTVQKYIAGCMLTAHTSLYMNSIAQHWQARKA